LNNLNPTTRTKLNRLPKRASYEKEIINKILDDYFVCHLGFTIENQPFVIPTCYGRKDDKMYFHGSVGSRMLKHIKSGAPICITVTNVNGIVLARSAFHHSINYHSVIIFGKANEIIKSTEKTDALKIITEHIIPGRWNDARKPNEKELKQTSVFSLKIIEASAKIREGGPVDEKEDMDLNTWAGVLPLEIKSNEPVKDKLLIKDIPLPDYIKNFKMNRD